MTTKKKKKVVKAWLIIDRHKRSPYCAYTDKFEARAEVKKYPGFHSNDVVVPCQITFTSL